MEDNSAFTYGNERGVGTVLGEILFSHVGMFFIISCYSCFGAWAFIKIETAAEQARYKDKQDAAFGVNQTIDYTASLLWFYGDKSKFNWTYDTYNQTVFKDLKRLEAFVLDACEHHNYDGTILGWNTDWTFMNALLLCMTILTTIGYGTVTPVTPEGQLFCIAYSLVGIPVFLVFMAQLGDGMADGFTYIYSRICCRCCRSRRYLAEVPENQSTKSCKQVLDDVVGEEEYMNTKELFVPITIIMVVLHVYMIIGAVLFSLWENWDLTGSFYFTFVTVSTIGYGDFVPGKSLAGDNQTKELTLILKLLVTVLYIVLGIALLSMCVNLMQEQIVEKVRWAAKEIGVVKDNSVKPPAIEDGKDGRKDSLLPIAGDDQGTSPFRDSSGLPAAQPNKTIPGIIDGSFK